MKVFFTLLASCLLLLGCDSERHTEIRDDCNKFYEQAGITGTLVLYDPETDKYIFCNKEMATKAYTPASTFKICNSLIALETKVVSDENFVIKWDSVVRNPVWDKDLDLKSAFSVSAVWYYQELARRIGKEKMKFWLDKSDYGNADTTGGIDRFWLEGGLRISPLQQIEFLKKLYKSELPFSESNMLIVKNMMLQKDTIYQGIRAKSGWGVQNGNDIGWYVGYLEVENNVYYFANCIFQESNKLNELETAVKFDESRKLIVFDILKYLDIIE